MNPYFAALCCSCVVATVASAQATAQVERLRRGDTSVVRTTGPGRWGTPITATEVSRIPGRSPAVPFGRVGGITPLPGGEIIVWDPMGEKEPTLSVFDSGGRFRRTFSRMGSGPGEFRSPMMRLAVGTDGIISMYDASHLRINRFGPTGTPLTSFPMRTEPAGGMTREHLRAGARGSVYALSILSRPTRTTVSHLSLFGYVHYSSTGRVLDTIPPQRLWFSGEEVTGYEPTNDWAVLPDGRVLAWRTDRVGFLLKGPKAVTTVELVAEAPLFAPLERRELQAVQDYIEKHRRPEAGMTYTHGVIPERKRAVTDMRTDAQGRVWLRRSVPSVRTAPRPGTLARPIDPKPPMVSYSEAESWVAFQLDGTYLGEVRFPLGVQVLAFDGEFAWGTLSIDDEPVLVKYRIRPSARPAGF